MNEAEGHFARTGVILPGEGGTIARFLQKRRESEWVDQRRRRSR